MHGQVALKFVCRSVVESIICYDEEYFAAAEADKTSKMRHFV